jgi:hypothetical protein
LKAIDIRCAEMGLVNSRVDGSVMFRVITPELTLDQRATLLGFHGKNARVMVEPLDTASDGLDEVTTEMHAKTPCQRLRSVLFVHWKTLDPHRTGLQADVFEDFYRRQMDKIIEGYKSKNLPEQT